MKKRLLILAASLVLLAVFVVYSNPILSFQLISKADVTFVLVAIPLFFIGVILRVLKWQILISRPFSVVFPVQYLGITISNFSPGKSADPVKSVLLKAVDNTDVSKSFPAVVIERILDLFVIVFFSLYGLFIFSFSDYFFIIASGMAIVGVLLVLLFMVLFSKRCGIYLFKFLGKIPSLKITESFVDTFYSFRIKKSRIFLSFVFTLSAWILEGFMFYFILRAFYIETPPIVALLSVLSISLIISIASFLPGGIGSFEITLAVLMSLFVAGNTAPAVLLYRFISFWFSVFIGGLCFVYLSRKIDVKNIVKNISVG